MLDQPDSITVTILRARIDKAQAEYDELFERQASHATDKGAQRLIAVNNNINHLKTLLLRYCIERRYVNEYTTSLNDGMWRGAPLSALDRTQLIQWRDEAQCALNAIEQQVSS